MKKIVSVPSTPPFRPCANCPISSPNDLPHRSLCCRCLIKCLYSIISPVVLSSTAPANAHSTANGNFRLANLLGVTCVDREISIAANMASCAMDDVFLRFDLVLVACVGSWGIFYFCCCVGWAILTCTWFVWCYVSNWLFFFHPLSCCVLPF
jgi:hypothetical protein